MKRQLVLGGDPLAKFGVPDKSAFDSQGDWIDADGCRKIAQEMIATLSCFESLKDAFITYLWKRQAKSKPKLLLGKCQRPSGLLRYFSHSDFVIWFAANNCRDLGFTNWQMEALIFHELKHAKIQDAVPVIVPHDCEVFADEIKRYGLWKGDLHQVAEASAQALLLPFEG